MSEEVILDITTVEETVTIDTTDPEVIEIKVVSVSGSASWNDISDKPTAFPPTAHKSTHAIGGPDALSPADIGAQPAGNYATGGGTATGINTGDQTITLTGDVTGSGTSTFTATIANDAVTFSKMAHIASGTIIGRHASGTGSPQSITIDGGLVLQGGKLELSDIGTAGIYKSVTVDGKGRVTAGTNPTTLAGYGITDAAALVHTHGNISNSGAIGATSNLVVVTGTGGILTTQSRSGIDSRTSFPNDVVTAATADNVANTIVKRNSDGESYFHVVDTQGLNVTETYYPSNAFYSYLGSSAATHRTALGLTSLATTTAGTGVTTALAANVGSSGAFVVNGGALGTPSSGTLANATGLPISTGVAGLGSGVATFLATPTSANLAAAVTDETGSGSLVLANSPTLTSPSIAGAAQFTGTDRPTSAATGSPAATSLITRADGDARFPFSQTKICSQTDTTSTTFVDVNGWTGWALEANTWYKIEVCACVTVTSGLMYWSLVSTQDLDYPATGSTGSGTGFQPNGLGNSQFRASARIIYIWASQSAQTAKVGSCHCYFRTGPIAPTIKIQTNQPGTPSGTATIFANGVAVISKIPI